MISPVDAQKRRRSGTGPAASEAQEGCRVFEAEQFVHFVETAHFLRGVVCVWCVEEEGQGYCWARYRVYWWARKIWNRQGHPHSVAAVALYSLCGVARSCASSLLCITQHRQTPDRRVFPPLHLCGEELIDHLLPDCRCPSSDSAECAAVDAERFSFTAFSKASICPGRSSIPRPAPLSYLVCLPRGRFDLEKSVEQDRRPVSLGAGAFVLGLDDRRAPDVTIT